MSFTRQYYGQNPRYEFKILSLNKNSYHFIEILFSKDIIMHIKNKQYFARNDTARKALYAKVKF
ncbi:hypothetical protein CGRAC_0882 [Campylobacter gracilis]|nr:hypothetical protein CGRAC_0882 [Campylobacter gracilis]